MAINVNFTSPGTPPQSSDAANFISRADAFVTWISTFVSQLVSFVTQANALEQNVNAKEASAVQANTDAQIAMNTAIAASGATRWISGAAYLAGAVVWSPLTGTSYRSKVNTSGTTDPSIDDTNWFNMQPSPNLAVLKIQAQSNYGGF